MVTYNARNMFVRIFLKQKKKKKRKNFSILIITLLASFIIPAGWFHKDPMRYLLIEKANSFPRILVTSRQLGCEG